MLTRSHRLSTEDFNKVMSMGKASNSPLFLLRSLGGQSGVHIAAVAPSKTVKMAAARNYVRRRVYEAVHPLIPNIKNGTHAILFSKNGAAEAAFKDISTDIKALFVKAGIMG